MTAHGRHDGSAATYEGRRWRGQRGRDGVRTRRRGVLTGASDGVDGGGEDDGVARSDTRSTAHDVRRAAGLSGCGHGRRCGRDGDVRGEAVGDAIGRRQLSGDGHARSQQCFKAQRVAAMQRQRADKRARRGKRRLTGGPLMSAISELKIYSWTKIAQNK
jgi:hypothetical protein